MALVRVKGAVLKAAFALGNTFCQGRFHVPYGVMGETVAESGLGEWGWCRRQVASLLSDD